jgi:nitrate reductase NapD
MNLCGVLVHAFPDRLSAVEAALTALPGVEIHLRGANGRLVVTVEDTDGSLAIDRVADIHRVSGVVAAALVTHHFEPVEPAVRT